MERSKFLYSLLRLSSLYNTFVKIIATDKYWNLVPDFIKANPGRKNFLDLGCGTGFILDSLPEDIDYLGIDYSKEYIDSARTKYGDRGLFLCLDLSNADIDEILTHFKEGIDIVWMAGLLHHLPDGAVQNLVQQVRKIAKEKTIVRTGDPTYSQNQSFLSKYLVSRDRGRFVRSPEEYASFFENEGFTVQVEVRNDLLRIPYDHCFMRCKLTD